MPVVEELALELNDKKKGFNRADFIQYYAVTQLGLTVTKAEAILTELIDLVPKFDEFIEKSYLNAEMQKKYKDVLHQRVASLSK